MDDPAMFDQMMAFMESDWKTRSMQRSLRLAESQ